MCINSMEFVQIANSKISFKIHQPTGTRMQTRTFSSITKCNINQFLCLCLLLPMSLLSVWQVKLVKAEVEIQNTKISYCPHFFLFKKSHVYVWDQSGN